MAAVVGKYAAKKMLGTHMDKYKDKAVAGADDPFYTTVPGRNGKPTKVNKQIPKYIPAHDSEVLAKAKSSAYMMDMSLFDCFGIRFGVSSVIGLIPEIGDLIDVVMAVYIYRICCGIDGGLPPKLRRKMRRNIVIDFLLGLVPFLGDLADAWFRCNTMNVALLDKYLNKKYGPQNEHAKGLAGLETMEGEPLDTRPPPPPYEQPIGKPVHAPVTNWFDRKKSTSGWLKWGRERVPDVENRTMPT